MLQRLVGRKHVVIGSDDPQIWGLGQGPVLVLGGRTGEGVSPVGATQLAAPGPALPRLFNPDRWLLWMGVLFVVIVYFFPSGIVGRLRNQR
jgi:branched-chain amino acid transport system permease protein